jgi:hypothetical protein
MLTKKTEQLTVSGKGKRLFALSTLNAIVAAAVFCGLSQRFGVDSPFAIGAEAYLAISIIAFFVAIYWSLIPKNME